MEKPITTITIAADEMKLCFDDILLRLGFRNDKAEQIAHVFTQNSLDGVYTHGVNRFPRFVEYVQQGFVKIDADSYLKSKFNGIEQWDGNLGPGILNAIAATNHSMKLADEYGIGCIALSNTNHWMRGGTYGWQAAMAGYVFIGWTNTIANMPAWGATDARLGNNPLVIALPFNKDAIVLDMAMSQYSYGSLEQSAMKNEKLPVYGGFDKDGNLSSDPAAILAAERPMPVGYWKGAGLSLLLDILAAVLSGGSSTHQISKRKTEYGLSQVFVAINIARLPGHSIIATVIENVITDYKQSLPQGAAGPVTYPGERVLRLRKQNLKNGIPVMQQVWDSILKL